MQANMHRITQGAIKNKNLSYSKLLPWIMWLCAAIFFAYQFIVRVSPGVITNDLMRDLTIQAGSLGILSSCFYLGYAPMQIPVGILLDRIGVRRPLTTAILFCAAGCILFATASSLGIMALGRFLIGIGAAFGLVSSIKLAALWFPKERFGIVIGLTIFIGITGATFGGKPLADLVNYTSWRTALILLGIAGTSLAALTWMFVRDRNPATEAHIEEKPLPVFQSLKIIFKNPQTYIFGLYGSLMYSPLAAFADMWGVPYMEQAHAVSCSTAASAISMFYVGVGIGSPISSWLTTIIKSYKPLLVAGAFSSAAIFAFIIYSPAASFPAIYVLLFFAGFCASPQMLVYACVTSINPKNILATANGTHNMMCMVSGIILQPIVGGLLSYVWNGTCQADGTPIYSAENFVFALTLVPICQLSAGILTWFMKETYQRNS